MYLLMLQMVKRKIKDTIIRRKINEIKLMIYASCLSKNSTVKGGKQMSLIFGNFIQEIRQGETYSKRQLSILNSTWGHTFPEDFSEQNLQNISNLSAELLRKYFKFIEYTSLQFSNCFHPKFRRSRIRQIDRIPPSKWGIWYWIKSCEIFSYLKEFYKPWFRIIFGDSSWVWLLCM